MTTSLCAVFDRFTPPAREVVRVARAEAHLMHHAHVGTEHMVVGLAHGEEDAAVVLHRIGLTGDRARAEVVRLVGMGDHLTGGELPFTPAAKDALERALSEAMRLGHERVDSAHLLLAILRQSDAVARRMLVSAGAAPSDVRNELIERLGARPRALARDPGPPLTVRLGEAVVGDLGQPSVDARVLLEILQRGGAVAAWLREHGVDEVAVRYMVGER
jgi:ATP-dependent Clp protease ATP-binding subunit ClpC